MNKRAFTGEILKGLIGKRFDLQQLINKEIERYKDAYEGMMKGILEDLHPVIKIDYNMEKMFPAGTLEMHDCTPEIVGMMFMEIFAAIHGVLKTEESRKIFKERLKRAIDLYDKTDEEVGDL